MVKVRLWKDKGRKIAGAAAAVAAVLGLATFFYTDAMLNKIHYSDGAVSQTSGPSGEGTADSRTEASLRDSPADEIAAAEQAITDYLRENSAALTYDKNVLNILLIGCDSLSGTDLGRSDSMILVAVNKSTKKIILTSIMRDIYTAIPGYGNNRINAAFAYGGAGLLLETIQEDFKIKVDKFVIVNFFSFINIIDQLGGVTISVSDEELPVLNRYVEALNWLEELPYDDGLLPQAGDHLLLTGKQALGYCRVRYVGNADYERTERQRAVLSQIFDQAKELSIPELHELLSTLLPNVTTNLDKGELYSLILSSPALLSYDLEQDRIPVDGSYRGLNVRGMAVLQIDFQKNAEELQQRIYGQ